MLLLAWIASASTMVPAQDRDFFGASVAGVGDVDGGGLPDLAIGDPCGESARDRGQVWIVSTETRRAIRRIAPTETDLGFGWTLANVGDVDGDGRTDLAIGTLPWGRGSDCAAARVTLVSCNDGRVLHELAAEAKGLWYSWDSFGAGPAMCGVGDWNADGHADVAIGSPPYSEGAKCRGRVEIVSGKDAAVLRRFLGEGDHAGLGRALCAMDDVDGDGRAELVMSAVPKCDEGHERANRTNGCVVHVVSSSDGSTLAKLLCDAPSTGFGLTLSPAGDLDGDGRGDLWIGEPYASAFKPRRTPGIQSWSSKTWTRIRRIVPAGATDERSNPRFGSGLVGIDDLDGDGRTDVVVTDPGSFASAMFVLSAEGTTVRRSLINPEHEASNVGVCATSAGDLDGDGSVDVAVGGITVRGLFVGTVSVWSPKKGLRLREFTRESIQIGASKK